METKEQHELRLLLRLERSTPKLVDQDEVNERIQWTLPNGRPHRDFGPAVEFAAQDLKIWYQHGKLHREDGPAMTGNQFMEEWLNDITLEITS